MYRKVFYKNVTVQIFQCGCEILIKKKGKVEMDIIVLAGGLSTERDVSFVSGNQVTEALRRNGHRVILLDIFMGYGKEGEEFSDIFARSKEISVSVQNIPETAPDLKKVRAMREDQSACLFGPNVIRLCRMADIVFMALHGENGEDGRVQAAFDLFGIRYTGSGYLSSAISMNKKVSKQFYEAYGIPTPKGISMKRSERTDRIEDTGLTLPCVVKPCCGGSSIGVSIVREPEEYQAALDEAFRWEDEVVIESYIKGRELSVGVIEYKALPIIELTPKEGFYDYKNKYKAGSTVETCPAELPEELAKKIQGYAEAVARAVGLDTYARMDFLLSEDNEIYCLEANTLPGMTPTSLLPQEAAVVGMSFDQLCEHLIEISLKRFPGR